MRLIRSLLSVATLLFVLGWAASAQAQQPFSITGGGGELRIGNGLLLPIAVPTPAMTGTVFPPLLVPPAAAPANGIMQTTVNVTGNQMTIPSGVLNRSAAPGVTGVFPANPKVFQVATTLAATWPRSGAVLAMSGRTGAVVTVFVGPQAQTITYMAGTNQFGGPGVFSIASGPGAAGGLIPGAPVTVWINPAAAPPMPGLVAALAPAYPNPTGVHGQAVAAAPGMTTPPGPPASGIRVVTAVTGAGLILGSFTFTTMGVTPPGITNAPTSTKGHPWTTGTIVGSATAASPPESFTIIGGDARVSGIGTISLVTGGFSNRTASGPNINRAYMRLTLPEPGMMLGTAGALAGLALCHAVARRRSR